jgi:hypothetical protein
VTGLLLSRFATLGGRRITYVGGAAAGFTDSLAVGPLSLTSLTGGIASSPAPGDLIVVYLAAQYADTGFYPLEVSGDVSGAYSSISALSTFEAFYDSTSQFFAKFAGGTPDASVTGVETYNYGNGAVIAAQVWRNVNAVISDVTAQIAGGSGTNDPNPPSITPVTPGAVVLAGGAIGIDGPGSGSFTSSDLENFVQAKSNNGGFGEVYAAVGSTYWTGGAVNPAAFGGVTSDDDAWTAITIALRPV